MVSSAGTTPHPCLFGILPLLLLLLATIITFVAAAVSLTFVASAISLPCRHHLHLTTRQGITGGEQPRRAMGQASSSLSSSLEKNKIGGNSNVDRREKYIAPTSPMKPIVHYIFLVHGWMGNSLEQDYLASSLYRQVNDQHNNNNDNDNLIQKSDHVDTMHNPKRVRTGSSEDCTINESSRDSESTTSYPSSTNNFVVYSPKCNEGRTHDGIRLGGIRLANEIVDFIRSDMQERRRVIFDEDKESTPMNQQQQQNNEDVPVNVTYSMVGNSLGGLYARYAISLLPYQLPLINDDAKKKQQTTTLVCCLHPNIFCTTATPHLGVSKHTYLPIPRLLENVIGTGMRTTGRDLFRLNGNDKGLTRVKRDGTDSSADGMKTTTSTTKNDNDDNDDDEQMQCIILNMCLQEKYLSPLRNFRHRVAYANAYGTDFQVPTSTAAFLSSKSGVKHHVVAFRRKIDGNAIREEDGSESSTIMCKDSDGEGEGGDVPPFIVAVCETKKEESPLSSTITAPATTQSLDDDLHIMSQSLDKLGWTKVFIDIREGLPVSGITPPTWLRSIISGSTLDNLICERRRLQFRSLTNDHNSERSNDETKMAAECILTSQELAQSTYVSDSINVPLGHSVMVANSKTERYAQFNRAGQPVMDKLAKDLIRDILSFE